jgi:hypothetical protein
MGGTGRSGQGIEEKKSANLEINLPALHGTVRYAQAISGVVAFA